jgi:hypothetical protein
MASVPLFLTPFVGRERELALYRRFLASDSPWVLVITGQGGIGKSTLLRHFADRIGVSEGSLVITLDFAMHLDPLAVLDEISWQVEGWANAEQVQMFRQAIADARGKLAQPVGDIRQEVHLAENASLQGQGMQMNISAATLELRREIRRQVTQALYTLASALSCGQMILLLDTGEWLGEREGLETGQWFLNEVLPLLSKRLQRRGKRCSVVLASRVNLALPALQGQDIRRYSLPFLEQPAVDGYLSQLGMSDANLRQRVYNLTHGHALCVEIVGVIWQQAEPPLTAADFPELHEQFNEQATVTFL